MLSRRLSDRTRAAIDEASDFMGPPKEEMKAQPLYGGARANFQDLQLYSQNVDWIFTINLLKTRFLLLNWS